MRAIRSAGMGAEWPPPNSVNANHHPGVELRCLKTCGTGGHSYRPLPASYRTSKVISPRKILDLSPRLLHQRHFSELAATPRALESILGLRPDNLGHNGQARNLGGMGRVKGVIRVLWRTSPCFLDGLPEGCTGPLRVKVRDPYVLCLGFS
jgi:hypothetical protein